MSDFGIINAVVNTVVVFGAAVKCLKDGDLASAAKVLKYGNKLARGAMGPKEQPDPAQKKEGGDEKPKSYHRINDPTATPVEHNWGSGGQRVGGPGMPDEPATAWNENIKKLVLVARDTFKAIGKLLKTLGDLVPTAAGRVIKFVGNMFCIAGEGGESVRIVDDYRNRPAADQKSKDPASPVKHDWGKGQKLGGDTDAKKPGEPIKV